MKCKFCTNYEEESDKCKNCKFDYNEEYNPLKRDDWDILNLKEEDEWEHIQIMDRLYLNNVDCLFADIWWDNNLAILVGTTSKIETIAEVLNVHKEVIYSLEEKGLIIINLFQEKYLRGDLNV